MKLVEFLTPTGYSGSKYFSEEELKQVTLRALPRSFQNAATKSVKMLDHFSLKGLQDFIETCLEEHQDKTAKKVDKGDIIIDNNNNAWKNAPNPKKRKGWKGKNGDDLKQRRGNMFCCLCKDAGRSKRTYTSHNPPNCLFKKKEHKESQKLYSLLKKTEKSLRN